MNLLDIVIIVTIVFLLLKGVLRGFIKEVASLMGVVLGIWLASIFHPQMANFLKPHLPSTSFLPLLSFVVIFTTVLILSNLSGTVVKLLFLKSILGWADRAMGAGLAVVKGVIITYLVIVLLTFFLPAKTPLIAKSKLAPLVIVSYQSMIRAISPERYKKWKEKIIGKNGAMGGIIGEEIHRLSQKRWIKINYLKP